MPRNARPRSSAPDVPNSKDKILDVAEALFARSGYAGVGLREVAETVGLRKSTLFHHFASKTQLYSEVLGRVVGRIDVQVRPALVSASGSCMDRLEASVEALIDALAQHPGSARLLLRGLFEDNQFPPEAASETEPVERALALLIEAFQELAREGIDSGELRPVSVPDAIQTVIGATVYHFASGEFGEQVTGGPIFSAEAVARRKREVNQFLRAGLTAGLAGSVKPIDN
jgi:AcrR family transcriptional regulator